MPAGSYLFSYWLCLPFSGQPNKSHKNFHMTLFCFIFLELNQEFLGTFFKLIFTLDENNRSDKLATVLPRYSFWNLLLSFFFLTAFKVILNIRVDVLDCWFLYENNFLLFLYPEADFNFFSRVCWNDTNPTECLPLAVPQWRPSHWACSMWTMVESF